MKGKQTILILGAGIAGLRCALDLADQIGERKDSKIVLVNKTPYHTLHSTLYEVVTAKDIREVLCMPLRELIGKRPIHLIIDTVKQIDPIHQKVSLNQSGTIRYDYLVIGLGNTPDIGKVPGIAEYATVLNSFEDALYLRAIVNELLIKKKKISVVIGGAGAVGCELAGTLAYFNKELCQGRDSYEAQVVIDLIEQGGRVLPGEETHLALAMEQKLRTLGVSLYFGKAIKRVNKMHVKLSNNSDIPYDLLIWTGGSHGTRPVNEVGFETDARDRIRVMPNLQARGFSRVYVVGDAAHFGVTKRQSLSPSVVYATTQGAHVAKNIYRQLHNHPQQSYVPPLNPRAFNFGNYAALLPIKSWTLYGKFGLLLKKLLVFDYLLNIMPLHKIMSSRTRRSAVIAYSRFSK